MSDARRRAHLDRESIIEAAFGLAANGDVDAVSVRKLGVELGCDPTAIYRHFRDIDELHSALIERLYEEVVRALPAEGTWIERLTEGARTTAAVFARYPAITARASGNAANGPSESDAIEHVLTSFAESGLPWDRVAEFYAVYANFILGFASTMVWSAERTRTLDMWGDGQWIRTVRGLDAARYPTMVDQSDRLLALNDQRVYESGVRIILDAAAAAAQSPAEPSVG
jgi:AcrR family transcriptional regulator